MSEAYQRTRRAGRRFGACNGLSLKTLIFPDFVAPPERHGSAPLPPDAPRRPMCADAGRAIIVLVQEARGMAADAAPDGAIGLGHALAFLRASNMQVMRLQLAAERQDRRGVMAAIDELVGIDRELERLIGPIPEVSAQRHELLAERLVLARGKIGPAIAPVPEAEAEESESLPIQFATEPEPYLLVDELPPPARRWPWVVAALLVLLAGAAVAFWMFGGEPVVRSWVETMGWA